MARRSVVRATRGRDGAVRVGVVRCGLLLGGLVGLVGMGGCGATIESRQRTVVDERQVELGAQYVPELDRTTLELRQDEHGLLVGAARQRWCQRRVRDEAEVEEHVVRRSRGETAGEWLALMGGISTVTGAILLESEERPRADPAMNPDLGGLLLLGGLGVTIAGIATLAAADAGSSDERHRLHYVGPERQLPLATCPGPDAASAGAPARVELALPDGSVLPGTRSRTGLWHVAVDDALWEKYGNRIDADVRVDGMALRRVVLERKPP